MSDTRRLEWIKEKRIESTISDLQARVASLEKRLWEVTQAIEAGKMLGKDGD